MGANPKKGYKPRFYVDPADVHSELENFMLVDGFDLVLDLERSSGANLHESRNGKSYIDFFTCFASMPIGMNHPKMLNENFINYLGQIGLNKTSNSDIYTETMAAFVKTFFKVANIDNFKYSFYISGGALAVENALKAAFDWKVRKNLRNGYAYEHGSKIMHFRQSFHGRTGYTMSLTNTDPAKTNFYPKFNWPRIINPYIEFPVTEENIQKTINKEKQAIIEIEQAFVEYKDDIAGIIIEPIQGEGGDNHFRPEFMQKLRELADENEALLIFDEVQTGVGITGKWWAHQHTGVVPDIMCFGKKMQVCGITATDRLDEEPENVFRTSSRINSTWGGNLVDMARSTRYLEIIDEDQLVNNAADVGNYLLSQLQEISELFPEHVCKVRGTGLFCAFDMPSPKTRENFRSKCYDNGLIILPSGNKSMRFRPPLNITKEKLNEGLDIIKTALGKTAL